MDRFGCVYGDILQCECYLIGFGACVCMPMRHNDSAHVFEILFCLICFDLIFPTILWQMEQHRDKEKKQLYREREKLICGAVTLIPVREETYSKVTIQM